MSENNNLYDNISAARIVYQDIFENELDIIKELKIYLIESGFISSEINQLLYNFYQHINTPILLETIQGVLFISDPNINTLIHTIFNQINDDQEPLLNNPINIINLLNSIIVNLNNTENNHTIIHINQPPLNNVIVTVDDDDFDKLKSEVLTADCNEICTICMSSIIKNEQITILNCEHLYHNNCITPYLKEYNYKCPVCRTEVGKAKYNI